MTTESEYQLELKSLKPLILLLAIFYSIAIILWLTLDVFFYFVNFVIIGTCIGLGIGLWPLFSKRKKYKARQLSQALIGGYLFFGLGFKEDLPPRYKWVLAQVGGAIKPRLKPSRPYRDWAKLYDLFKHSRITSFKTAEVMEKTLRVKYALNSVTSAPPDNLRADLSPTGKVNNWHKFWNFIEITKVL